MNFEIQNALGGADLTRSALTTLLPPNAKVGVTEKVEFGSMPDLRGPVPEIESTCHVFDAPCQTCEDDDEDDITLAELKEQLEDDMTLSELQDRLLEEEEEEEEEEEPIKFVDEMTFYSRSSEHLPNF